MNHTPRWVPVCPKLRRVQEKARANSEERFTSLAHYITVEALMRSYHRLDSKAAPGIDGVTKEMYEKELETNLKQLHERLKSGKYRASPVQRRWIEKPDGGKRPLGIPTIEDKIVQGAVVEILNSVYEDEFKGFSYGFRPGRSAHHALQSLQTALQKGKVNWVLDADISKFFDSIDHKQLMSQIRRRVTDRSLLRLIGKWLRAGTVEEDGRRERGKVGTPQGGVISPLLANIFLHYALDTFVNEWRKSKAEGEVYIVRYADDFVIACEWGSDARRLLIELDKRFAAYGLKLNLEKTKLLRFGRQWVQVEKQKAETFDFLGLTHIAGKSREGHYTVKRKTSRKRYNRSAQAINEWIRTNRHEPLAWQCEQLGLKLKGHYNYYGVRNNFEALSRFYWHVMQRWKYWLRRRSRKCSIYKITELITNVFILPRPKITHTEGWLDVNPGDLLRKSRMR